MKEKLQELSAWHEAEQITDITIALRSNLEIVVQEMSE